MTCYYPLKGYRSLFPGKSGKHAICFGELSNNVDLGSPLQVPCGQCIGCKLEYSRQWALRCYHEASLYKSNCFITLTYSSEHLPVNMSVDKKEFSRFMKKLRKKYGEKIRFFHCGEYGEMLGRPHYHACIFNFDFPDKVLWKQTPRGDRIYTSAALDKLWGKGFCTLGDVTFESAAYVARYVVKKITGERAKEHYTYIDTSTGEFFERAKEYTLMSRRPGIGKPWLDKFLTDVYPDDFVVARGRKMKPPRYYDVLYEQMSPAEQLLIKEKRKEQAREKDGAFTGKKEDNHPDRLLVREKVKLARISTLKRGIDNDT